MRKHTEVKMSHDLFEHIIKYYCEDQKTNTLCVQS